MAKRGAIFKVPAALIIQGLKAICALPAEAECEVAVSPLPSPVGGYQDMAPAAGIFVKARSPRLPEVPEGTAYPRRLAAAGQSLGREE